MFTSVDDDRNAVLQKIREIPASCFERHRMDDGLITLTCPTCSGLEEAWSTFAVARSRRRTTMDDRVRECAQ